MSLPKDTLWKLNPHTKGKHLVLRNYLQAWFPILASVNKRITFIDGFAGPGEYQDNEPGSPLIALNTLREHGHLEKIGAEIRFIFIEAKSDRAEHLGKLIDTLRPELPKNVFVDVYHAEFSDQLQSMFRYLDEQELGQDKQFAPTFLMIDPFGVKGVPMSVVTKLLAFRSCEVYVSLMYEAINRHLNTPEYEEHMDELFGFPEWRKANEFPVSNARRSYIHDLYRDRLKSAGARYVTHFKLYEGNRHVYSIFFGTNHLKGCERMKQAIWKVVPFGNFAFREGDSGLGLFGNEPNTEPLQEQLRNHFGLESPVRIETLLDFMRSDATQFHPGHLKSKTLRPMEAAGKLEIVNSKPSRRKFTYPDGTMIRFKT